MTLFSNLKTSASALAISAMFLSAGGNAAIAAEGKALLDSWVTFGEQSPLIDVSYSEASESGDNLDVSDFTVRVSASGLVNFFGQLYDPEFEAPEEAALDYVLSIPDVTFRGLSEVDDAVSIARLDAETIVLEVAGNAPGSSTTRYNDVVISDLSFAKWPEVVADDQKPVSQLVPLIRAATDVSLSAMTMQFVETTFSEDGVSMVQTYGPVLIGPTVNGDISTVVASGFAMSVSEDGESDPLFEATAAALNIRDYNYGTTLEALLKGPQDDAPYEVSVGAMEAADISVSVPEENLDLSIERVAFDDIGVRAPAIDLLATVDRFALAEINDGPEPSEQEIIELVGSIYGSLSLGRFAVEGVAASGDEIEKLELGSFVIADLSAAGLGEISVNGLDVEGQNGEIIKTERYALEGFTFPPLAALVGLEEAVERQDVPAILEGLPKFDRIVQNGIRIVVPEENADIEIGSSLFEMLDHIGPIPTGIRMGLDGLRLSVESLEPEDREPFEALGLETVVASADTLIKWDRETTDINIDLLASVEQLGTLSGEGTIGSVPAIVFEQPNQSTAFALLGATFKNLTLRFDDDGVVERGIAVAAEEEGIGYDAMELRLKGLVPVIAAELDDVELAAEIANAVTAVIDNGAAISLRIAASTPLPIVALNGALNNPASIPQLFDIEVANP